MEGRSSISFWAFSFMKDNRYYVYQIIDPRNEKVLYVGKGTGGRCYTHFCNWTSKVRKTNMDLHYAIEEILENTDYTQFDCVRIIHLRLSKKEAYAVETSEIHKISYENLLNKTPWGGKGSPKEIWSETRIADHLERLIKMNKSDWKREQLSKAKKGKKRPEISNEKHGRAKARLQYDLEGNLIKRWNTAKEASIALNIASNLIGRCCKGKKKSAGGFIWKYEK
jgi:hypothetical protein